MRALVTENLALLAEAPAGFRNLRTLLLDLAVRGAFASQVGVYSPDDSMSLPCADINLPFRLPLGWQWSTIGDQCQLENGDRSSNYPNKSCLVPEGIPFINAGHLSAGRIDMAEMSFISRARFDLLRGGKVRDGDILYCLRGSLGKSALVDGISEGAIASSLVIVRPSPSVAPLFLLAYLNTSLVAKQIAKYDNGTAQPNLAAGSLRRFLLPLPPVEEQNRIVAKVDELMALCDRLETRQSDAQAAHARLVDELLGSLLQARDAEEFAECWGRVKGSFDVLFTTEPSIDALKQAVLQLAVTGRLVKTEQDASEGWVTQRIEEFCTVQGGIQKTPLRRPVSQHFPYLRVLNVQRNRINVAELERYELTLDELDRWRLNAGDLLIVEGNGSENEIGRCAIWSGEVNDCVYQNHLMRVRPHEPRCVVYLALYLNSPEGMAHMRRLAITTSGLFNLSVGKIRSIPVAMPPLAEQHRIVAKVDGFITLCDQLKTKTVQARALNEWLAKTMAEQAISQSPLCQDGI